jgi:hypothetical protein
VEYDPTVADVHTDPSERGRVLHVGTGMPRAMVVSVDVCGGPRAYVGLASSYYEQIETDYTRLDDPTWARHVTQSPPNDVRRMTNLIAR